MPVLIYYQFPPELMIKQFLESHLPYTGLKEKNINVSIITGHPIFDEGFNESIIKTLPKIGIEHISNERVESLAMNYKEYKISEEFKIQLQNIKQIPEYARITSTHTIDLITQSEWVQEWTHIIINEVIISGFASGNTGRNTARILYETIDGLLAPLQHDLTKLFPNVNVLLEEKHQVNIVIDDFAMPVFGFEVPIRIQQLMKTIRAKTQYTKDRSIVDFDLYLNYPDKTFTNIFNFKPVIGESNE